MPDLTPDVTTAPNFDPGRVAIASGWGAVALPDHPRTRHHPGHGRRVMSDLCKRGHELAGDNLLIQCRECRIKAGWTVEW